MTKWVNWGLGLGWGYGSALWPFGIRGVQHSGLSFIGHSGCLAFHPLPVEARFVEVELRK